MLPAEIIDAIENQENQQRNQKQHNADRTESRNSFIYALDSDGAKPRRISAGHGTAAHAEKHVAFSRDGTQLAFLSDAEKEKQLQLYVAPASGGAGQLVVQLLVRGYLQPQVAR